MSDTDAALPDILRHSPVRVVFGMGRLDDLGVLAREEGAHRILLVSDSGVVAAGHVERAVASLHNAGIESRVFADVSVSPTTDEVDAGVRFCQSDAPDFVIGLGGGSVMDCAKGINLLLSNGGRMTDHRGEGPAAKPMLPMILIPTTAGTGSEAQSFALISDANTHQKMACGDRRLPPEGGLRPRVAILDPNLTRTLPREVAATAGIDAIAHAIESAASTRRTDVSRSFSREAWSRLEGNYLRVSAHPSEPRTSVRADSTQPQASVRPNPLDATARAEMLLGAHLAGAAVEYSMLGAAHACANPLTARYGLTHGVAVGIMLSHVIRFNTADGSNPYDDLGRTSDELARRVEQLLSAAGLPRTLSDCGVPRARLDELSVEAAEQWTAAFNPVPLRPEDAAILYAGAFDD